MTGHPMTGSPASHARPMIYSAHSVRQIIADLKTNTRRVVKILPRDGGGLPDPSFNRADVGMWSPRPEEHDPAVFGVRFTNDRGAELQVACPYGKVGDRLWVREAWQDWCPTWGGGWCGCGSQEMIRETHRPAYRATPDERGEPLKWKSPIHMPRWASRLTLEITEVRVERLNDISESDAKAEGVTPESWPDDITADDASLAEEVGYFPPRSHAAAYARLWDSINGGKPGHAWADNPFVWALTFQRIEADRAL